MPLRPRPLRPHPPRHALQQQTPTQTKRHGSRDGQRGRNRRAFKILAFAGCVFRHRCHGDVEAGEAGETTEDEKGKEDAVDGGAETEGKGAAGGGDAEGDLLGLWRFRGLVEFERGGQKASFCFKGKGVLVDRWENQRN